MLDYGTSQDLSLDVDVSALEKMNVIEIDHGKNGGICKNRSETCFENENAKENVDSSVSYDFGCDCVCSSIDLHLFLSS